MENGVVMKKTLVVFAIERSCREQLNVCLLIKYSKIKHAFRGCQMKDNSRG